MDGLSQSTRREDVWRGPEGVWKRKRDASGKMDSSGVVPFSHPKCLMSLSTIETSFNHIYIVM